VTQSDIAVDFSRILRSNSGFLPLKDAVLDFTAFEEGPLIGRSDKFIASEEKCLNYRELDPSQAND
jgi:hypothetical protein